jgi:dTDP-4-dehydrorhamnose 3,5-epimerase
MPPEVKMEYISGVKVRKLRLLADERGWLMEMLRSDWEEFEAFGQTYVTACYPGVVKAWHYHKEQTDCFTCVHGMVRVGLVDTREGSPTQGRTMDVYMGVHNPVLVKVPPGVLHGFKGVSAEEAIIVNIPDRPYRRDHPDEHRLPAHDTTIPFDWSRQDR